MQDQIISYKTAVLAKEKGFDWKKIEILEVKSKSAYLDSTTQSLLQKWLREEHRIVVLITIEPPENITCIGTYSFSILKQVAKGHFAEKKFIPVFENTYEEALEEGLQHALTLIE